MHLARFAMKDTLIEDIKIPNAQLDCTDTPNHETKSTGKQEKH